MSQLTKLLEPESAGIASQGALIIVPQKRQISKAKPGLLLLVRRVPSTLLFLLGSDLTRWDCKNQVSEGSAKEDAK